MTNPMEINEIILTRNISTSIRDLVHSTGKCLFGKLIDSLPGDVILGGTGLPFCDELVKNPVQLVAPVVFVQCVVSSAAYPNGFCEPPCSFVCLLIKLFSLVPPNHMIFKD